MRIKHNRQRAELFIKILSEYLEFKVNIYLDIYFNKNIVHSLFRHDTIMIVVELRQ